MATAPLLAGCGGSDASIRHAISDPDTCRSARYDTIIAIAFDSFLSHRALVLGEERPSDETVTITAAPDETAEGSKSAAGSTDIRRCRKIAHLSSGRVFRGRVAFYSSRFTVSGLRRYDSVLWEDDTREIP